MAEDKEIIRTVSRNSGGSLTIVIPPKLAKHINVKGGDHIQMEPSQGSINKVIVIRKLVISKQGARE